MNPNRLFDILCINLCSITLSESLIVWIDEFYPIVVIITLSITLVLIKRYKGLQMVRDSVMINLES